MPVEGKEIHELDPASAVADNTLFPVYEDGADEATKARRDELGLATSAALTAGLAGKSNTGHAHTLADISDAGTAAAAATGDFATAAQGAKADTAVQPGDLGAVATSNDYADLSNKPVLGTAAAADTGDFATAAQGATADTALQPGDVKESVEVDAGALHLVGDAAAPGNNKVYGTDGAGVRGWKDDPAGGGGDMLAATYDPTAVAGDAFAMDNMVEGADTKIMTAAERSAVASALQPGDVKNSVEVDAGSLQLVGDAAAPGNNKVYGTNGSGVRVWKDDPSGGADADAIHVDVAGEINGLTEKVTPVSADWAVIEDSAAGNAKKKVQLGNLPGGGGGGGGPTATIQTRELIEEIELTSAGEFDFNNIPQTYEDLYVEVKECRSSGSGDGDGVAVFFNEDLTVTNYFRQGVTGYNGSVNGAVAADNLVAFLCASGSPSNARGEVGIQVPRYASTTFRKYAVGDSTALRTDSPDRMDIGRRGVSWNDDDGTTAISRIRIRADGHATDGLTGIARLYGIKEQTVGAGSSLEPVEAQVREKIETITLGSAGEFDFNNIPADYESLYMEGEIKGSVAASSDTLYAFFNADTTAGNYRFSRLFSQDNAGGSGGNIPSIASIAAASSPTNAYTSFRAAVPYYTATDKLKQITAHSEHLVVANSVIDYESTSVWDADDGTSPITRIQLRADGHATDGLLGTVTLYGVKTRNIGGGADRSTDLKDYPSSLVGMAGRVAVVKSDESGWEFPETGLFRIPQLIETITLGTAGEFDFASIPGTYDDLYIEFVGASDESIGLDTMDMFYNTDLTATNYRSTNFYAFATVSGSDVYDRPRIGYLPGTTAPANSKSSVHIHIPNYAATNIIKTAYARFNLLYTTANQAVGHGSMHWDADAGTTPITRIRLRANGHATDGLIGTAKLYGIKDAKLPVIP